jgi:hypothetical protein
MKARFVLTIVVSLLIALPLFAEPVGKMTVSASSIEWQSTGTFDRIELVVAAPNGTTMTREFQGSRAAFRLADLAPRMASEGTYTYELRAVPKISDEVKARLAAARAADDDAAIGRIKAEAGIGEPVVQAGAFTVLNGSFVTDRSEAPAPGKTPKVTSNAVSANPGKLNPTTPNDVVTADDEIIQGSLCVGLDCVNNESFGFDTIRLKENNTRIKFQDTSTTSGCPNNQWQLTANDACGGANKFSIEDITGSKVPFTITAAAPTNSLFVASSGKVGFGNSSPGLNLHITATDTPAIRQEQTNGGGFTAWTWDIGANEANWFVRDLTSGSRLPFRIRPGAPTSSIDISASGQVGVGTASPSNQLHVLNTQDASTVADVQNSSTGTSAAAVLRTNSDTAQLSVFSHSSTRTIVRFGVTLGGWNEINAGTGNGLAIGTTTAVPLILGTNSSNRLQIDGTTGAVTVSGNFTVTGTKNFAMPDPANETKAIYYTSLEGPEAGTYFRGSAKTVDGEAVIELPGYFSRITESERMTVQLTPVGDWGQLYVSEKTPERLVIKVAKGGTDLKFDYLVQGIRKGYLDYEVVRENHLPKNN